MSQIRGEEYDASKEIGRIKEILEAHNHDLNAVTALEGSDGEEVLTGGEKFGMKDLMKEPVLKPFLITLTLTVLIQFTGQGSITFYTIQIFSVRVEIFIEKCFMKCFFRKPVAALHPRTALSS